MKRCTKCGAGVGNEAWTVCPECGAELAGGGPGRDDLRRDDAWSPRKPLGRKGQMAALLVAALFIFGFFFKMLMVARESGEERRRDRLEETRKTAGKRNAAVALYQKAQDLLREGRGEAAEPVIERLIEEHPDYPGGWYLRGQARRRRGDFRPALNDFARTCALSPRSWHGWAERAVTHALLEDRPGYERALAEARRRNAPDNLEAQLRAQADRERRALKSRESPDEEATQ